MRKEKFIDRVVMLTIMTVTACGFLLTGCGKKNDTMKQPDTKQEVTSAAVTGSAATQSGITAEESDSELDTQQKTE